MKYTHNIRVKNISYWSKIDGGYIPYTTVSVNRAGEEVYALAFMVQMRNGISITFKSEDNSNVCYPFNMPSDTSTRMTMFNTDGTPFYFIAGAKTLPDKLKINYDDKFARSDNFILGDDFTYIWSGVSAPGLPDMTNESEGIDIVYEDDVMRQILAPKCLADIIFHSPYSYSIMIYPLDQVGDKINSLYQVSGLPHVEWKIENPNGFDSNNQLIITELKSAHTNEYRFTYSATAERWDMLQPDGLTKDVTYSTFDSNGDKTSQSFETRNAITDRVISLRQSHFKTFAWGSSVTNIVEDPYGLKQEKSFTYYESAPTSPNYGQLKQTVWPSGRWRKYEYDQHKRRTKIITPFQDSTLDQAENLHNVTLIEYSEDSSDSRPQSTTKYVKGIAVSKTYSRIVVDNNTLTEIDEIAATASSAFGDPANRRTSTVHYPDNASAITAGKTYEQIYPDSNHITWTYDSGNLTINADPSQNTFTSGAGDFTQVIKTYGITNSPAGIANKTLRTVDTWDGSGNKVLSEKLVYTGNDHYPRIGWTVRNFDSLGRQTNELNSAGLATTTDWESNCCGKGSETDAYGLTTVYSYDDRGRNEITDQELGSTNIITLFEYDLLGNRIRTTTQAGAIAQISSNRYDTVRRLVYSMDTQGIGTSYQYSDDGLTRTTIRAGVTSKTVSYLDGRIYYTEQNGVRQSTYEYGVNPDGSQWTKTYTGKDGLASAIWQISTTDFLGRTVKTERPGFGGATLVSETFYNSDGTVARTTSTGSPDTLYAYNTLGEVIRTAQDINGNGVIDLAGLDRVNETTSTYLEDETNDWWLASYQVVYTNSSAIPVTNGISRTRLTGLGTSRTVEVDGASHAALVTGEKVNSNIRGIEATSLQLVNRDQKMILSLSSTPASALTNAAITLAGLQAKSVTATGVVTTHWYDSLGRRVMSGTLSDDVRQNNPSTIAELESEVAISTNRNLFTPSGYNAKGQVEWARDSASNNTWFAYNDYGQRYAVIQAVTKEVSLTSTQLADEAYVLSLLNNENFSVSYTEYSPEGQVLATYGNAYPVAYEYDDQNRMVAMATTRNESLRTDNLLTQLPAGETLSTWQPAESDKIDITKWEYDSATGLLTDKEYSDGNGPSYSYTAEGKLSQRIWARGVTTDYAYDLSGAVTNIVYGDTTPNVAYTYNRLGQQMSAITAVSTNTFVYSSTLELDYELQNGAKIDRTTDNLGRNTGYSLYNPVDPVNPDQITEYEYSNLGRFKAVKSAQSADTNLFTYAYLPGSDLLSGYTASTPSPDSTFLTVSRTYEQNRNLITAVTNSVGSVPSVVDAFTYHNDALGRRTQRSDYYHDGNNPVTTANTFGYNSFSEVTNAVMGSGVYAYNYDPIGNRQSAKLNDDTTSYAANGLNQYTNITGGVVSAPTYDLDGNMTFLPSTSGGGAGGEGWHCQWDAENRLLTVSNLTTAVAANYIYDHQSRRISKKVSNSALITQHSSFIYDGWNLIQEQTSTNTSSFIPHTSSFIPHTSSLYTWGLDLSGSLQGAGGVGGLLSQTKITASGASSYFPLADANGNAVTYLDDAGNVQAHYTYDAFGNTVSSDGDMDDVFPFRFSSKYLDDETGLYYYGFRYYSPVLGRWVSRDPIWEQGGVLLYGFVGNDGVNDGDLLGLSTTQFNPDCSPCTWGGVSFQPQEIVGYYDYPENKEPLVGRVNIDPLIYIANLVGRLETCKYKEDCSGYQYKDKNFRCTISIYIAHGNDPYQNDAPNLVSQSLIDHELGHVPIEAKFMENVFKLIPMLTSCVPKECNPVRRRAVATALAFMEVKRRIEHSKYHVSVFKGRWKSDWEKMLLGDENDLIKAKDDNATALTEYKTCMEKY